MQAHLPMPGQPDMSTDWTLTHVYEPFFFLLRRRYSHFIWRSSSAAREKWPNASAHTLCIPKIQQNSVSATKIVQTRNIPTGGYEVRFHRRRVVLSWRNLFENHSMDLYQCWMRNSLANHLGEQKRSIPNRGAPRVRSQSCPDTQNLRICFWIHGRIWKPPADQVHREHSSFTNFCRFYNSCQTQEIWAKASWIQHST